MVPAVGTNEPMSSFRPFSMQPTCGAEAQAAGFVQRTAHKEDTGDSGHCQGKSRIRRALNREDLPGRPAPVCSFCDYRIVMALQFRRSFGNPGEPDSAKTAQNCRFW